MTDAEYDKTLRIRSKIENLFIMESESLRDKTLETLEVILDYALSEGLKKDLGFLVDNPLMVRDIIEGGPLFQVCKKDGSEWDQEAIDRCLKDYYPDFTLDDFMITQKGELRAYDGTHWVMLTLPQNKFKVVWNKRKFKEVLDE